MHLEREQVQRVLHGELGRSAMEVERHLGECGSCRDALAAARAEEREIHGLLGALDHEVRVVQLSEVRRHAGRRGEWLSWRWAAGLIAAVGLAGVAYAIPASPLRGWVERLRHRPTRTERVATPPALTPAPVTTEERSTVSVMPGASLVIVFARQQPGMVLHVALGDAHEVSVSGPVGAATFSVAPGRVLVDNSGDGGEYRVLVPRSAPHVEVVAGGRRVWEKDGERVEGVKMQER